MGKNTTRFTENKKRREKALARSRLSANIFYGFDSQIVTYKELTGTVPWQPAAWDKVVVSKAQTNEREFVQQYSAHGHQ